MLSQQQGFPLGEALSSITEVDWDLGKTPCSLQYRYTSEIKVAECRLMYFFLPAVYCTVITDA